MWGSGGSAVEIARPAAASPAIAARPMNVSPSRIRMRREGLRELRAGAEAGAQHELARRRLVLEDRTAVGARQLDRARHDRR